MSAAQGLMILAGGTGGHVFPALAVAKALAAQEVAVRWMGTEQGLEAQVVPEHGIEIDWIRVQGMRGKGLLTYLATPFRLLNAVWQAIRLLSQHRPKAVLGMGGFVAGPGGIAAFLLRIPMIIHEQNAVAGLTNRWLSPMAARVLSGFDCPAHLPARTQWVGNPVRADIEQVGQQPAPNYGADQVRCLIVGGSQGAHSLNQHMASVMAQCALALESQGRTLTVLHQAGRGRAQATQASYEAHPAVNVDVVEFIENMATALKDAHLVVCRAGAMTIAELSAAGRASVLVPYPHSAGDHQDHNAHALRAAGGAVVIQNSALSAPETHQTISDLLSDPSHLDRMGRAARSNHRPDALQRVVDVCQEVLNA